MVGVDRAPSVAKRGRPAREGAGELTLAHVADQLVTPCHNVCDCSQMNAPASRAQESHFMHHRYLLIALLFVVGSFALVAAAETEATLQTAPLFTSGMVLQEGIPVPVWGWAAAGETVTVRFAGQTCTAQTGSDGSWQVRLAPLATSDEGRPLVVSTSKTSTTYDDVLVGEVWLLSGQSNMSLRLPQSNGGPAAAAAANDPALRLFSTDDALPGPMPATPRTRSFSPRSKPYLWRRADPDSAADMSAIGWYFAQELRRELKKPVGLILASRGGSICEAWLRREALLKDPHFATHVAKTDAWMAEFPAVQQRFSEALAAWKKACSEAKAAGKPEPAKPNEEPALGTISYASGCYNNFIAAIHPYAVRGVLWYQGEGNADYSGGRESLSCGMDYQRILTALITDWRQLWGQEHLPFYIVGLASWWQPQANPPEKNGWAEVREAQARTAATVPDSGMVVTIDLGDVKDIHPRNKAEVGRRLALVARAKTYGQQVACFGPTYRAMQIEGSAIRLTFDHAEGGLVAKDGKLPSFAVAGADRKWTWAEARIDGDSVIVTSPKIASPVAARYAWDMGPVASLFNSNGLPAVPFRTDDWPGISPPKPADR